MDLPCIDLEATGRNIRSLRIANGFRVTDISTLLSLDKQAVYKWEYGKCLPQLENLFALSHLYQLKVEDIVVLKKEEASTSSFPFSALVLLLIIFVCTAIYGISSRIRFSISALHRQWRSGPLKDAVMPVLVRILQYVSEFLQLRLDIFVPDDSVKRIYLAHDVLLCTLYSVFIVPVAGSL